MKAETLKARRVKERKEIKMSLLVILGRLTEQKESESIRAKAKQKDFGFDFSALVRKD